jgi:hypothetical protein
LSNESADEEELDFSDFNEFDDFEEVFPAPDLEDVIEVSRNPVGVERLIWNELKQKYIYPEEVENSDQESVEERGADWNELLKKVLNQDLDENEVIFEKQPTPSWLTMCPNCFLEISKYVICDCGWDPDKNSVEG